MAGKLSKFITEIKSATSSLFSGESSDNNDFSNFRNIFANSVWSYSNSFSARRAYMFYDNSRSLASNVDRVSDAFAEIEPSIYDKATNEWITAESDTAEAEVLRLLKNPGFSQTWRQFAGDLSVSFLLTRDAFFIMHGNINFKVKALAVAKPFYVDEEEGRDGYIQDYRFQKTTGRTQQATFTRLKPSVFRFTKGNLLEIYHIMGKTRDDGLRGRSPIAALVWDLLQNIQGTQYNANMLKNQNRPSGALVTDATTVLSDTQFTRMKEQLEDQYSGAMNAGRTMVLEGGVKYENLMLTNRDMDFAVLMGMSSDAVAERYKIPLAITNKDAQTLDNYKTAIITMYDDAVEPLTQTLYEGIEAATFDRFGIDRNRFTLTANPSSINAAIIRQTEKMERMANTNAFTQNEIRAVDGFEAIEGGDTLYAPTNTLPVGEDGFVTNPPAGSRDALEDAEKSAFIRNLEVGGMSKKAAIKEAEKAYGA